MEKERESHKAKIEEEIASIKGKIAEKEEFVKKFEQETVAMKSKIKELNSKVGQKEKDVAVMKSKFQSDIDKIKNEIRRLQGDVERLEKSKQHTATTQNKESSLKVLDKNKSQNENKTELPIPELKFLPKIGTLYQFGGKDYLAIVDWNDFDSGEQERERLSAKLCAERS
jgi:chromosome segregation ATPase